MPWGIHQEQYKPTTYEETDHSHTTLGRQPHNATHQITTQLQNFFLNKFPLDNWKSYYGSSVTCCTWYSTCAKLSTFKFTKRGLLLLVIIVVASHHEYYTWWPATITMDYFANSVSHVSLSLHYLFMFFVYTLYVLLWRFIEWILVWNSSQVDVQELWRLSIRYA